MASDRVASFDIWGKWLTDGAASFSARSAVCSWEISWESIAMVTEPNGDQWKHLDKVGSYNRGII